MRDLATSHVPYISLPWIGGAFTPAEQHSPEMDDAIKVSDVYIAELTSADEIVIGTPPRREPFARAVGTVRPPA